MRRRLYLQLYLALLASALVCLVVAAVAFRLWRDAGGAPRERMRRAAIALAERLPDARSGDAAVRLGEIADEFGVDVIVGNEAGPFRGVPSTNAFQLPRHPVAGWRRDRMGPVLVTPLDDGAWAAVRPRAPYRRLRLHPFFATLAVLAVVMAIGSYPVARRVTRRLERLTGAVERWGRGDLGSRVPVSGSDEVALLAATFNQAAERLDLLLAQQRQTLANASHELRSPLARLRMGLELIAEEEGAARRRTMVEEIHRDIVELDALIEDVLLLARADARVPNRVLVAVDMRALVEEEAARTGASVVGPASAPEEAGGVGVVAAGGPGRPIITGDVVLLRHMIRNLVENARQYGRGTPVSVALFSDASAIHVAVDDGGPGVPDEERERIFAPFYRRVRDPQTEEGTGHGLGLALVRQVARYHGGDVVYEARAGGGSRFKVTLPLGLAVDGGGSPATSAAG